MADDTGWIKIYRQIEENPLYFSERFTKIQAWMDLILLVNYKPKTIFIRGNAVELKRGETGRSIQTLAKRWKWNERTVKSYLNLLKKEGMIQYRTNHVTTVITILNYDLYQGNTEQNTEQSAEQTQNRIQTNKKGKKEKKDKKKFIPPSLQDVKDFFKLRGYTEESAIKAFNHYDLADWHDAKGHAVQNWKQKMNTVWFRDENKIPVQANEAWK